MRCGPQVFVVTILLLGFMDMIDIDKNSFEVLEIFAGEQRLVKLAKGLGIPTASMDKAFDPTGDNRTQNNSMDLNTSAGFLFLFLIMFILVYDGIHGDSTVDRLSSEIIGF